MSAPAPFTVRRTLLVAVALLVVVLVAGCGDKQQHPTFANSEDAASSGLYVDAGPMTYQVQLSRQLNPYSAEDHTYLMGLPAGEKPTNPSQMWFGVFLWGKNQSKRTQTFTPVSDITITDTQDNTYYPVNLNTAANDLACTPKSLAPNGVEPGPNSPASYDATQGCEVLFKLNQSAAYANRPLTLNIKYPGAKTAEVQLDL